MRSTGVMFLALVLPLLLSSSADAGTTGDLLDKVKDKLSGATGGIIDNFCSESAKTCKQPWMYCDNSNMLARKCRYKGWVWGLMVGGPILAVVIIAIIIVMVCKRS